MKKDVKEEKKREIERYIDLLKRQENKISF
jgi:hypothetical protein